MKIFKTSCTTLALLLIFACSSETNFKETKKQDPPMQDNTKQSSADSDAKNLGDMVSSEAPNSSIGDDGSSETSAIGDDGSAITADVGEIIVGEGGFKPCVDGSNLPIEADVFRIGAGNGNSLPRINTYPVVDKICMENFNIPKRRFEEGFPGVPNLYEWFAIQAKSTLIIPESGEYTFYLSSDDGSILYLDGNIFINNDGVHGVREINNKIYLNKGAHSLEIRYFQGPRFDIALQLFWSIPSKPEKHIVPRSYFKLMK